MMHSLTAAPAQAAIVHVPCPECKADSPGRIAEEDGLGINRCGGCGLIYVSPRFAEPQAHYLGERESILAKYGPVLRGEHGHNRDTNYDQELRAIARWRPTGRLLDVGTHCGFFLRRARGMGWELHGVEPSPQAAALARESFGLDITAGTLEEASFAPESFDVVTLVDVFEHVDQPIELLTEVRRVMRSDGILFIKVPNAVYSFAKYRLARQLLRLDAEIFDAKEHVAHYTLRTLRRTLGRAGFDVIEAFVPRPIQDGAAWKCALRSGAHALARLQHRWLGAFGPLAMDVAVLATPREVRP
jgi:SAM-dependent methyltransferase